MGGSWYTKNQKRFLIENADMPIGELKCEFNKKFSSKRSTDSIKNARKRARATIASQTSHKSDNENQTGKSNGIRKNFSKEQMDILVQQDKSTAIIMIEYASKFPDAINNVAARTFENWIINARKLKKDEETKIATENAKLRQRARDLSNKLVPEQLVKPASSLPDCGEQLATLINRITESNEILKSILSLQIEYNTIIKKLNQKKLEEIAGVKTGEIT
jgi:hypothetical protein